MTIGVILDQIKNAPTGSPLAIMIPYLQPLNEFNDFAGAFHHDTSGKVPRQDVTDTELQFFGDTALRLIHTGFI